MRRAPVRRYSAGAGADRAGCRSVARTTKSARRRHPPLERRGPSDLADDARRGGYRSVRLRPSVVIPRCDDRAGGAARLDKPGVPVGRKLDRRLARAAIASSALAFATAFLLPGIHDGQRRSAARGGPSCAPGCIPGRSRRARHILALAGRRAAGRRARDLAVLLPEPTSAGAARCVGRRRSAGVVRRARRCCRRRARSMDRRRRSACGTGSRARPPIAGRHSVPRSGRL